MQDDALAEFFSKYVSNALDLYLAARDGAQSMAPLFPFGAGPMEAFMRFFGSGAPSTSAQSKPEAKPKPEPEPTASESSDIADLRRELQALKKEIRQKS